jgi:SAM-dependent methyltransferase
VDAGAYDGWYHTPRGAWIGGVEFVLLRRLLRPEAGQRLLDVGCGTGYFTRRFAQEAKLRVVGIDPNTSWLDFAQTHGTGIERYCVGAAEDLPFGDRSFDYSISVTALCFVDDAKRAVREILRVTRKRFAIGLLNRRSLLYLQKGPGKESGAYQGAHWHTTREVRALFAGMPTASLTMSSAVFLPDGGWFARRVESLIPDKVSLGAFIVAAGDVM